jgi:hypothetical protein
MEGKTYASLLFSAVLAGMAGGIFSGTILTANNVLAQKTNPPASDVSEAVVTRKILIVDEKGHTRAKLGLWPNGRPAWFAYDKTGVPGPSLNLQPETAGLSLIGRDGKVIWSAP